MASYKGAKKIKEAPDRRASVKTLKERAPGMQGKGPEENRPNRGMARIGRPHASAKRKSRPAKKKQYTSLAANRGEGCITRTKEWKGEKRRDGDLYKGRKRQNCPGINDRPIRQEPSRGTGKLCATRRKTVVPKKRKQPQTTSFHQQGKKEGQAQRLKRDGATNQGEKLERGKWGSACAEEKRAHSRGYTHREKKGIYEDMLPELERIRVKAGINLYSLAKWGR